jgi:hypothetical protein
MKLISGSALVAFAGLASGVALPPSQQAVLDPMPTNKKLLDEFSIPTVRESAAQARRILRLESIGTLSTIFPNGSGSGAAENRPSSVGGTPLGLMDYYGDCEPDTGNPTILAIQIASSFKNVAAGSNLTLSLRWHSPEPVWSIASLPRFALIGYLEDVTDDVVSSKGIDVCFAKYHHDSVVWRPGNRIHSSKWVRLVVQEIYWIGGFGDRAYIGWIPKDTWTSITEKEIQDAKLPGE